MQAVEDFQKRLQGAFDYAVYAHEMAKARQSAEAAQHVKAPRYEERDNYWQSQKLWREAYTKARPSAKLGARWLGLFRIVKLVAKHAVKLDLPHYMKMHLVVHAGLTKIVMKKPAELCEEVPKRAEVIELDTNGEPLFKVKEILARRWRGRGYQRLTVMEGKANQEAEWQRTKDFLDPYGTIIEAFQNYTNAHRPLPELIKGSEESN